ncbi:FAD-dependent oxidoreductase [Desulfonatronum thioautotrophicum]|uniref:FAD-dependent oxidoreductase n=1 Tax=Desulfonatronum thioautotrophicum TaxID=617001 RepID=UPI000A703BB5|nr:FAD-dependent oxidoreductase [Desulfonatronum thioautotrophicum]
MANWNQENKTDGTTPENADEEMVVAGSDAKPHTVSAHQGEKWLLPEKSRHYLTELFQGLRGDVTLLVFVKDGVNEPYNQFCSEFVSDLARISTKIKPHFASLDSELAQSHAVRRSPTILVQPETYQIRFTGAPAGEEGKALIEAILMASSGESGLTGMSANILDQLQEPRHAQVFVSPTCPYCPQQVVTAFRAAVHRPDLVSAECVETGEHQDLALRFNVGAVPHTVINADHAMIGLVSEERFVAELLTLQSIEASESPDEPAGHQGHPEPVDMDLLIIGGGPAGLTAAIYAARSGLRTMILEGKTVGGQIAVTPIVENYPGFSSVSGMALVEMMVEQARRYVQIVQGETVQEVKIGRRVEALTEHGLYRARALLLATGASWRTLGVPGESELFGRGVSFCATCDGYLYKNRHVLVVGGGNTAVTNALYLKNLGASVGVIHRRDTFRAERQLVDALDKEHIPVYWNSVVEEILGTDAVQAVRIRNLHGGEASHIPTDGVFLAIGETANAGLARDIGLQLTSDGSIQVDERMRTSHPRIYAAGDVTGGVRQIVTAVGQGSVAALSIFEDLSREG